MNTHRLVAEKVFDFNNSFEDRKQKIEKKGNKFTLHKSKSGLNVINDF